MQAATATRRSIFVRGPVVVFLVLAYVGVLHYAYVQDIAPIFTYLQYGYRAPDPFYYGAAIGMAIVLALLLPRHIERPSHLIVWVLYLIAVLPGVIVPQISPALSQVEAFQLALWVAGCFLPVVLFGTRQALRGFIPLVKMSQRRWWLLIGALWLVLTTFVIAYAGIKLTLPSFEDVYGVRGDFRVTESSDPALAYVVPLLDKVIDPLMIIRGLWYRRWTWAAAGTLGQVYLYSQQGSKTAILAPVAIVVAYLYLRSRRPVGPTHPGRGRGRLDRGPAVGLVERVEHVDVGLRPSGAGDTGHRALRVRAGLPATSRRRSSAIRCCGTSSPTRTPRSRRTWSGPTSSATRSPTPTPAGSPTATPTSATRG